MHSFILYSETSLAVQHRITKRPMQHIKPMGKGDPLCPLGFHPQVRWPTRCKRCFRDYKEHGNRNKEQDYKLKLNDTAASSPSLSSWNSKAHDEREICVIEPRSWTSTSNLGLQTNSIAKPKSEIVSIESNKSTSSWISTPNLNQLADDTKAASEAVNVTLPRRRPFKTDDNSESNSDNDYRRTAYTIKRRNIPNLRIKPIPESDQENAISKLDVSSDGQESDVFTDAASTIADGTETLVNSNILQEQIESLKQELTTMRMRCEKTEKEKNEMLMRRVASLDSSISTKTTASELNKLQEKISNLTETCETLTKEKRSLTEKLKQLEYSHNDIEVNSLKSKLIASKSLCEELMDENAEIKRELRDMEEEIEEMQDNFRENEADEYSNIKKELEQTGKNCRILSFKLRKCERRAQQLVEEKIECERKTREEVQKLQKDLDDTNEKIRLMTIEDAQKRAPMLGNIPKTPSGEKVSRASLTRGGSQEDPAQLLRDLQDSMEREADLREQLRYAEEEAETLRKKVSRVEDDNESFLLQLKKMATKVKRHRSSPTHSRLGTELSVEKDEGISDEEDPGELRVLLELSEQETAVLHKKVKELEETCDILKRKTNDLQDKLLTKEQKLTKIKLTKNQESELQDSKQKLQENELESAALNSELNCFKKKLFTMSKARSGDTEQNSFDVQRQMKVVEQEVNVLRTRISSLESENEKLQAENKHLAIAKMSKKVTTQKETELKSKIAFLEKQLSEDRSSSSNVGQRSSTNFEDLKERYALLEAENSRLTITLKLLKEGSDKEMKEYLQKRTPKIVTDSTSKHALQKMVHDLECEIGEILLLRDKLRQKTTVAESKEKLLLKREKDSLEEDKKKLTIEIDILKSKITNLNDELKNIKSQQNKISDVTINSVKDDSKLKTELLDKKKRVAELEKKVQEIEDKNKKTEKLLQTKKEKNLNLEKELDLLKKEANSLKTTKINEAETWAKKESEFKSTLEDLRKQVEKKCEDIRGKDAKIKELERSSNSFDRFKNNVSKMTDLEKKLTNAQVEIKRLNEKIKSLEAEKKTSEQISSSSSDSFKNEIKLLQTKIADLQKLLDSEKVSMNQLSEEQTRQITLKDTEIKLLKKKLLIAADKKSDDTKQELQTKVDSLQSQLDSKKREYDELTSKYELLEDEHVKLKSQSNLQKEQMQSQIQCTQKELISVQNELRILRDTYNSRQDQWIKEKLKLEDKLFNLETQKISDETSKLELNKLKLMLEAKDSELDKLYKENSMSLSQMEHMRKENEELQKKLDDFDKVINVQRNMVAETSLLESQLREVKNRLYNEEQGRKIEVAALKLRYENHVSAISNELKDVQAQVMRFKHERNTYKHLLENAQKAVVEAKNTSVPKYDLSNHEDHMEELHSQVATLEQQISCMEDELSESRVENSRLKTELVSERSAWDVKLSELTSKINELEEDRVLHSGRTKTVGLKTRMELAWQKEREEQNRLLQETSTLARDLRQTLFEVERERDKERLETKRRFEQMKRNADEEQDETKRKLHELQCDLLELRDAHAKLRTTNEKLRREKERNDKERDWIKQNSKINSMDYNQKKVDYVLELVTELSKTSVHTGNKGISPTPNKKHSNHSSRETSLDIGNSSRENSLVKEDSSIQFQQLLQRLFDAVRLVKADQNSYNEPFNRNLARKAFISRRPASTESDKTNEKRSNLQRHNSLHRKCISLEQTSPSNEQLDQIWRMEEDTDGSYTSIQSTDDSYAARQRFDQSFDSRLSNGSTQSELVPSSEKKKKKRFFGKLKKLTKSSSRSVNDDSSFHVSTSNQGNAGSNSSISSNVIPNQESGSRKSQKSQNGFIQMFGFSERAKTSSNKDLTESSASSIGKSQTLPRNPTEKNKNERTPTSTQPSGTTPKNIFSKSFKS